LQIDLDLTAATSTIFVSLHMSVQFEQGILVWSCSNIEHQAQFRLQVLANALKEPPMGINFSIVSMLDAKANVDTSSL
jgi:hypothetical protein